MASIFDKQLMSDDDIKKIAELEDAWRSTDDKNLRAQIHNQAESIRQSYGYSGGADGSEYNALDSGTAAAAAAAKAYAGALDAAEHNRQQNYMNQQRAADSAADSRLREAYIKNMQNTLGLDQSLKANGISGGLSESTRAAYDNSYMNQRDGIYADTLDAKQKIAELAAQSAYDSSAQKAKLLYDSATDRADRMTAAEQRNYDRSQDAFQNDFRNKQFEYQQKKDKSDAELENRRFEYQQQKDLSDRELKNRELEYQQLKDALEREYKRAVSAQSAQNSAAKQQNTRRQQQISNIISLMKSGYYSPEFADILGIDGDQLQQSSSNTGDLQKFAWNMLENGIYDDSFPSVLGYSEDILKKYAKAIGDGLGK